MAKKAGPKLRMLEWVTSTPLARECRAEFGDTIGARREAFCERCHEVVLNPSAMTRVEAELRLLNAEKVPCIAFTRDESGEVSFAGSAAARFGCSRQAGARAARGRSVAAFRLSPPSNG
jgi:hypothetical protein